MEKNVTFITYANYNLRAFVHAIVHFRTNPYLQTQPASLSRPVGRSSVKQRGTIQRDDVRSVGSGYLMSCPLYWWFYIDPSVF